MKIAVVHGGSSSESKYSTENAKCIQEALKLNGHDAYLVFYDKNVINELTENRPELVFLCVQGEGHGDGTFQGILDFLKIPYTGTKMQQAAVINDKNICQSLFADHGLPVPKHFSFYKEEFEAENGVSIFEEKMKKADLNYPVISKSLTQGACLGIKFISSKSEYEQIKESFAFDNIVLVEEYMTGSSVTVPLVKKEGEWLALPLIRGEKIGIKDGKTIFNHDEDDTPADFSAEATERIKKTAIEVARITGAQDYCRVDLIYDPVKDREVILEINAVPGLREESYYTKSILTAGFEIHDIIELIVKSAISKKF